MCLVTKMIAPKRATRDIICYKVLEEITMVDVSSISSIHPVGNQKYGNTKKIYRTPNFNFIMEIGKQYDTTNYFNTNKFSRLMREMSNYSEYYDNSFHFIGPGFFHVLTDREMATKTNGKAGLFGHTIVSVECIIPKGSLYYISADKSQMCATSLKLIKIIGNESDQNG